MLSNISISTNKVQVAITRTPDQPDGLAIANEPVVNSAGDPFDPPAMREESRMTIRITKNEPSIPEYVFSFADCINSGQTTIAGLTFNNGTLRVDGFDVSAEREREGAVYREVVTTVQYNPHTWQAQLLDWGPNYIDTNGDRRQAYAQGDGSVGPQLLDAVGGLLPDGSPAEYLFYDIYNLKVFQGGLPGFE